MAEKNPLQLKAAETIRFLKSEDLITKEHSLTVALIFALAEEWDKCTSSTQRALISKELRAAIMLLPKPEVSSGPDEADDFDAELAKLTEDAS